MDLTPLFGSKCRVKILEKFVLEQAITRLSWGFFMRELSRDLDEQINSIRRELINLEELGILKSKTADNKKIYTINVKSPIYEGIIGIFRDNYDPISPLKEFLSNRRNIQVVSIHQSLSSIGKRENPPKVDILLIGEIDRDEFAKFLEKNFMGKSVKFAIITELELEKRLSYDDKLITTLLTDPDMEIIRDKINIAETVASKLQEIDTLRSSQAPKKKSYYNSRRAW